MADHLVRALLDDGAVRVVAAVTTDVAREAAKRHRVVTAGAVALARGATSGLLLATLTKGNTPAPIARASVGGCRRLGETSDGLQFHRLLRHRSNRRRRRQQLRVAAR